MTVVYLKQINISMCDKGDNIQIKKLTITVQIHQNSQVFVSLLTSIEITMSEAEEKCE